MSNVVSICSRDTLQRLRPLSTVVGHSMAHGKVNPEIVERIYINPDDSP